jgi:hypothetical protein
MNVNGRRNFQPGDVLSFGPFSLLVAGRLLKRADESIPLGARALDVLIALTERAGEVVSYRELISSERVVSEAPQVHISLDCPPGDGDLTAALESRNCDGAPETDVTSCSSVAKAVRAAIST